jgi:hypothetical protein
MGNAIPALAGIFFAPHSGGRKWQKLSLAMPGIEIVYDIVCSSGDSSASAGSGRRWRTRADRCRISNAKRADATLQCL